MDTKTKRLSELIDLLSDDSFIQWVRRGKENPSITEKWEKWLEQNPDKLKLVNEAKIYVTNLSEDIKPMELEEKELLRSKILEQIKVNKPKK